MPAQMNTGQARIVDQVLSNVALEHQEPDFVGHNVFPEVPVMSRGVKLPDFRDELTKKVDTERAPGAAAKQVDISYGSKEAVLKTHGLDARVPQEIMQEANAVPNIRLQSRAVVQALKPIQRNMELLQAEIARNPDNYAASHKIALTGNARWDAGNDDPVEAIVQGINKVSLDSGAKRKVVLLGNDVMAVLRTHAALKEYIKYSGRAIVTEDVLKELLGVDAVVVGESIVQENGERKRIWGTDVIIAGVPAMPASTKSRSPYDMGEASFGFTFRLNDTPKVETPYFDRKCRSWINSVDLDYAVQMTMPEAGYLIQNAVSEA